MDLGTRINSYLANYPFLKQFIKFCFVGGTAAFIHFSILYSFTEWFNLWYVFSNALGFFVSVIFNFIANKLWTFRNKERGLKLINQVVKFSVVLLTGLGLTTLIIYSLTEWVGLDYRISWIFATVMVAFWNFGLNRLWTFKATKSQISNLA